MSDGGLVCPLPGEDATLRLGRALAAELGNAGGLRMLLFGDLGAGKTTLVRGLVNALPGADQAQVASPSFTLANLYPTRPEIAHLDLYRLEHGLPGDDLLELLDNPELVAVVEWAQRLPASYAHGVAIHLTASEGGRTARFSLTQNAGETAQGYFRKLTEHLREFPSLS